MPTLHAQQRADLPCPEGLLDVVRGVGRDQQLGVPGDHPPRNVELLELDSCVSAVTGFARHVDGPELGADLALPQPGKVGVPRRGIPEVVGLHIHRMLALGADLPGEVVVTVDQGVLLQQPTGMGQVFGAGLGKEEPGNGSDQECCDEGQKSDHGSGE